ncbi:zinc ribbon domain-containing protein [Actinoplanes hulinensis]|uniref:Zinc ribbon domain-containing protein n=1 Tax=Actinoplanes hulinensis TaxID=1144547 RepID=A0ABS7BEB6_9ACTN|nr:zinc ribbon domain-containing protein [Actinoplanes hulinensis]MBW6439216.1 zinc ribbon domain-containing protein [Actinoplanes hulinensis]
MISPERMHLALISDEDFTTAQAITARAMPEDGQARRYALTGLLVCGVCGRRMSGHWLRRAAYRCRHGHTSAHLPTTDRVRAVYRQEARLAQDLITANSDLAHLGGVEDLASYLRARDAVIVCGFGTLTIEDAAVMPVQELFAEPAELAPVEVPSLGSRSRFPSRAWTTYPTNLRYPTNSRFLPEPWRRLRRAAKGVR